MDVVLLVDARLFAEVIHEGPSFYFAEAECCVGEAASEACWEPCYCVLLQDEQTLTAYRSEDMAVSVFFTKSLSDFLRIYAFFLPLSLLSMSLSFTLVIKRVEFTAF